MLDSILCNLEKETLKEKLPEIELAARELVVEIKNARSLANADRYLDLLLILLGTLAALLYKHKMMLSKGATELLTNFERLDDPIVRNRFFEDLKNGTILTYYTDGSN